jgi:alkylation response protein AidB-like acyl-CoA dehydrogenase
VSLAAARLSLSDALDRVAANADELDRDPRFPAESLDALGAAGMLGITVPDSGGRHLPASRDWEAVRAVARADGSVGRIYDGHLNAVERLALAAPEPLRSRELARVLAGEARLGVWGADPRPAEGEGDPARLVAGDRVHGAKVFCSGAGGLDAALVLVRGDVPGPPLLAYVDLTDDVEVDRDWYRAAGMRSSESHRVVFHGAAVLAVLGEPGELGREPFFGRDAIRTASCWAGLVDAVREEALALLAARVVEDDLAALAAGRMVARAGTVDALLDDAGRRVEANPEEPVFGLSVALRVAVADAARDTVESALAALGSRPLAVAGRLDRARRDLEVFLHQHRLDPLLARLGRQAASDGSGP